MRDRPGFLPLALLTAATVPMLATCGGGGGSSGPPGPSVTGTGFAPTSGPGDASGYFPAAAQDQWVLDYTTDDPQAPAPSGTLTVTVSGTTSIQGANANIFAHADSANPAGNYDQYFAVTSGGVTALGNTNVSDKLTPLIIPYVQLLFPVSLGQVSQVVAQNLPFGHDPNNNPITLDLTQTISNAAMESVDVPAGTFANVLKQTTTITATVHDAGQSAPITGSDTAWYAPGVGEIKEQASATGANVTVNTTGEVRRYLINGQLHGIATSAALDASLRTNLCPGVSASVPSVTSDGANFLVVALGCSSPSDNVPRWLGVLVGPDGTVLSTATVATPGTATGPASYLHAVSAFDGTHYLVVYEDAPALSGTVTLESVVLGTDGSVLAGPTAVATAVGSNNNPAATDNEALGFDGSRFLLIYTDGAAPAGTLPQESGIFIAPGTGQASGSVFAISQVQGGSHGSPAIAFGGTSYLVVWVDSGTSPQGLHAMRVSPAGGLLDAAPFAVVDLSSATLQESCCDLEPTVSFDGTNYLVAYRDPRGVTGVAGTGLASISAARISTAGVLLDGTATTAGIVVAASKSQPRGRVRSIFTAGMYWLVWETNSPQQLNATRVSPAGTAAAAWTDGFTMAPAAQLTATPAIAASSAGSLLVWLQTQSTPPPQTQLLGLRVYPTGP